MTSKRFKNVSRSRSSSVVNMGRVKELFLQMEGVIEELKEENEVLTKKFEEGLALLIQAKNDIEEQLERIEELETENERLKESVAYHTGRPLSE